MSNNPFIKKAFKPTLKATQPEQRAASTTTVKTKPKIDDAAQARQEAWSLKQHLQQKLIEFRMTPFIFRIDSDESNQFQKRIVVDGLDGAHDPYQFFKKLRDNLPRLRAFIPFRSFKVSMSLQLVYYKLSDGEETDPHPWHHSLARSVTNISSIESDAFDPIEVELLTKIVEYEERGSGWVFERVIDCYFTVMAYTPLKSGSYIPFPGWLAGRARLAGVPNIKNDDNGCFQDAQVSALCPPSSHLNNPAYYKKKRESCGLDFSGVSDESGVSLDKISKFEMQNRVACYVFEVDVNAKDQLIYPVYPCNFKDHYEKTRGFRTVDLLRLVDGVKSHYCHVKRIESLIRGQVSSHKEPIFFCRSCCCYKTTEQAYNNHIAFCHEQDSQRVKYPAPGTRVEFDATKMITKMKRAPYVMYGDFECIMPQTDISKGSGTTLIAEHQMCGYALLGVAPTMPGLEKLDLKHGLGEDFELSFFQQIEDNVKQYATLVQAHRNDMVLTDEQQQKHVCAMHCYVCKGAFDSSKKSLCKVRDHDHSNGRYLGAAHSGCNIIDKITSNVYVLFHNFRNYDSHLLMKRLSGYLARFENPNISVIGQTDEKFMSLTLRMYIGDTSIAVHFRDSMLFMTAGLEKIVNSLANVNEGEGRVVPDTSKFYQLQAFVDKFIEDHNKNPHYKDYYLKQLCHKQCYPYEHFTAASKFDETELPPIESFYSKLKGEGCSNDAYKHAQTVMKEFDCKTLWDYHDLYLATDVVLLADVFEHFRKLALQDDKLDPVHYVSLPGFSWDSLMLKSKPILDPLGGLELLSDPEMYLMIERGIRGGVSMISQRHAAANNRNMARFNPSRAVSFIRYLDMNNMYGLGMSQYLPVNGFRWATESECQSYDACQIAPDADIGSIAEISGYFPDSIHDIQNDYPMLPERVMVDESSEYNEELCERLNKKSSTKTVKLVPHLGVRTRYAVHYRALAQAIKHGFIVTNVHRVIFFKQAPWMKAYIDHNTALRAKTNNDFEKDFYKLKNNAVYGKTIENVRNHMDTKIIREKHSKDENKYRKYLNDGRLRYAPKLMGGMATFSFSRKEVGLCKPIAVGMAILDISKEAIYSFHYDYMMPKYGVDRCKLLMTDTDSLVYQIFTDDWAADVKPDSHLYDFSNYSKEHSLFSNDNKKVLGKMKDEFPNEEIAEFIGLKAKMYALRTAIMHEKLVHKGIQKSARTDTGERLSFDDYKRALDEEKTIPVSMNSIRSFKHSLHTVKVRKDGLSSDDNKRYLLDKIKSLAYGHYAIARTTEPKPEPEPRTESKPIVLPQNPKPITIVLKQKPVNFSL